MPICSQSKSHTRDQKLLHPGRHVKANTVLQSSMAHLLKYSSSYTYVNLGSFFPENKTEIYFK
jgi:hypothetical protein